MALSFSIHTRDEPSMDFIQLLLEEYNFGVIKTIHQDTKYVNDNMEDRFDVHYSSINEKGERLKKNLHQQLELVYGYSPTGVFMYSITPL
jgi:hypothetical protein